MRPCIKHRIGLVPNEFTGSVRQFLGSVISRFSRPAALIPDMPADFIDIHDVSAKASDQPAGIAQIGSRMPRQQKIVRPLARHARASAKVVSGVVARLICSRLHKT
jgi:hypothetical protein